jgi:signal transduction histidine kinase
MKHARPSRRRPLPTERVARLQRVTAALAAARDPLDVARVITGEGASALRARACVIFTLPQDAECLDLLAARGVGERATALLRTIPIDSAMNVAVAVRTGESSWIEREDQWARLDPRAAALREAIGLHALASLPLVVGGRTIGAVSFGFDAFRTFPRDERALLLTIARQGAQALERAQLYDHVVRARAEAERVSRLKDEFMARVSHELRTPSAAMAMWLHVLAHGSVDDRTKAVAALADCVRAQSMLVEDLLDVARGISGKLHIERVRVDLAPILASALATLRPEAAAKGLTLRSTVDADVPAVVGDPTRLRQVMTNLLTNAIKFTPPGGAIAARLFGRGGAVHIEIEDTGCGIAPEIIATLFTPFRQADEGTSPLHGGLGLGLAIVRQIVELHGGDVTARSEGEGAGATFAVVLPRCADARCADASDVFDRPAALNGSAGVAPARARGAS